MSQISHEKLNSLMAFIASSENRAAHDGVPPSNPVPLVTLMEAKAQEPLMPREKYEPSYNVTIHVLDWATQNGASVAVGRDQLIRACDILRA